MLITTCGADFDTYLLVYITIPIDVSSSKLCDDFVFGGLHLTDITLNFTSDSISSYHLIAVKLYKLTKPCAKSRESSDIPLPYSLPPHRLKCVARTF